MIVSTMLDKDVSEAYQEARIEELELYRNEQAQCDFCGEIFPENQTMANTKGLFCFDCMVKHNL